MVHKDFIQFMTNDMGYDYKIVESDSGTSANAVFYKRDKFTHIRSGALNLNYK